MPTSDDHERAEMYVELAKMSQESFLNRRSYEWKVAFGLWTAIGLITFFAIEHADEFDSGLVFSLGICYVLIGTCWLILWQFPLRLAFEKDQEFKHYYMTCAEGRPPNWPPGAPWPHGGPPAVSCSDWKCLWCRKVMRQPDQKAYWKCSMRQISWTTGQSGFTVIFLLMSWLVIGAAINGPAEYDRLGDASEVEKAYIGEQNGR